jgi:hypothetical protein
VVQSLYLKPCTFHVLVATKLISVPANTSLFQTYFSQIKLRASPLFLILIFLLNYCRIRRLLLFVITLSDTHTHTHTHKHTHTYVHASSVGLFWTSDRPAVETSTRQHTTDSHSYNRVDSIPQNQEASCRRARLLTARTLGSANSTFHFYNCSDIPPNSFALPTSHTQLMSLRQ